MIEDLIKRMFEARNAAHVQHWHTNSYAQHIALGDYYDGVIDALDKYVEAYQGTFGLIKPVIEENDISQMIHDEIVWLNENRTEITKGIPALENIIDELTGLHMSTLYKLENLR